MIQFRDFVPKMVKAPAFMKMAEYESFDDALDGANGWIYAKQIRVINIETVVLPNIWNRWEEGSKDTALGTSGDSPSHWHQFIRVWYRCNRPDPQHDGTGEPSSSRPDSA